MKRIGKLSGKIYPDDYDFSKCPECCICISDDEANKFVSDPDYYIKGLKVDCEGCRGCPLYNIL